MADAATKLGTACLCCRRRKLKCTREPTGCASCVKADLPCIYPTTDSGIKRKRGPYKKKDKPARQAHLDHVVKYLSDPMSKALNNPTSQAASNLTSQALNDPTSQGVNNPRSEAINNSTLQHGLLEQTQQATPPASEDLVKDALIALSMSTTSGQKQSDPTRSLEFLTLQQSLRLWNLFTTRVDPMTKTILCRDVATQFYAYAEGQPWKLGDAISYAAASSCNDEECLNLIGIDRPTVQKHFRTRIQQSIIHDHGTPDLQSMQALVLYLICVCREELASETWALFSLIVRNAELLQLHKDPASHSPVEAELRRRLWWTICSLESRCAEEGAERQTSLLTTVAVNLPLNLNDDDLPAGITELPKPRIGITSMSFVLTRWHIMKLSAYIVAKLRHHKTHSRENDDMFRTRLGQELAHMTRLLQEEVFSHCHASRFYDMMIMIVAEVMLLKCHQLLEFPSGEIDLDSLSPERRRQQLKRSVKIIRDTYGILNEPRTAPYIWFFRSNLQWHSLAVVITEIGKSQDVAFIKSAWNAVEPFVKTWARVYRRKQHDSTWRYVDELMTRAQHIARKRIDEPSDMSSSYDMSNTFKDCTKGILPHGSSTASMSEWPRMPDAMLTTPAPSHNAALSDGDINEGAASGYVIDQAVNEATVSDDGAMVDPLLDVPFLSTTFETDLDALNAVFSDPEWEYGFQSMLDMPYEQQMYDAPIRERVMPY